jgi:hypothetical protein
MITLTIIFILLYAYSIYKIKQESGSWENFVRYDTNLFSNVVFIFGTSILITVVIVGLSYLITNGLIP